MSEDRIDKIENPAQFLEDTGLLFEINRRILHPLGLALEITLDEEAGPTISGIWDFRDDDEGIYFQEGETFDGGLEKWERFRKEYADEAIRKRKEILGYVVQGEG